MIDIICIRRPAVWMLLAFCFASFVFADSRDPVVLKSQVVSLDVAAIERDANARTPFELTFGETHLKVVLAPAPLWPKEGLEVLEIGKDGGIQKRIVESPTITYAGDVVGEDPAASEARFTIAHGALEGYVLSATGWWFIEPLSESDPKAGPADYLVYASRDLDFAVDFGADEVKADDGALDEVSEDPNDRRIRLAMVADSLYVGISGTPFGWIEREAALVNEVNGIYRDQLHREFRMPVVMADFGGNSFTSTDAETLLNQFAAVVFASHVISHVDIAHLTTTNNLNDHVGGISETPGNVGLSQQVLVTASAGSAHTQHFLNTLRAAHELGHNFEGRHEYADEWCVTQFVICWDYERTLMWPSVYPDTHARFSDGTRNPNHNNLQRIDSEMTRRGFPAMP
jgi:hypothetical protein